MYKKIYEYLEDEEFIRVANLYYINYKRWQKILYNI